MLLSKQLKMRGAADSVMEHTATEVLVNPHSGSGELTVMFSGWGHPVPGHKIGPKVHEYFLIHTVLEGEGAFELLDKAYSLSAGDTFVIFPDRVVKYEANDATPWKYLWVGFTGTCGSDILAGLGITPETPVVYKSNLPKLESLYRGLRQSLQIVDHPFLADLEAGGKLRLLLSELGSGNVNRSAETRKPGKSNRQLDLAIRLMMVQYSQPISIDQLAKSLGYHRAHLCRLFKEETGLSPWQYLHKIRMEKAEELLAGDFTIAQVAASVGYNDPLFFTRQFRKWKGMPPTEFRERQDS
ncbi:AraC family transcriptional regulator [Gorillibacterium massiliense]|uniref:AraC family transcriptional regulator n=1 Tax=Gorillibacterium massiliense TaxID=1280390 RepID=UPI001EE2CE8D|nr:AraC family transcriptional regulator [Gorillibacterium massiliense]